MIRPHIIRHPQGNPLRVSIPLTLRYVEIVDGVESYEDTDFIPTGDVTVLLTRGTEEHEYIATIVDNVATIVDMGRLEVGTWAVTVLCEDDEGNKMRYKARLVIRVVDCTADAAPDGVVDWYEGMDGAQMYPILRRNDNG